MFSHKYFKSQKNLSKKKIVTINFSQKKSLSQIFFSHNKFLVQKFFLVTKNF